jgi:Prephenate dehydrogenase
MLFAGCWCIIILFDGVDSVVLVVFSDFWTTLDSKIELMDTAHHDLVLTMTNHIPHLITYTIVNTTNNLKNITQNEMIKYSAKNFHDFTHITTSDPIIWHDVFLTNRGTVLKILEHFSEDLTALQRTIRSDDKNTLFDLFTHTHTIQQQMIEQEQDDEHPDFEREHEE